MVTFDTNILIYAADQREPRKQAIACDVLGAAGDSVLLWQVACEFVAAARRLARHGLTTEEAWDQLGHHLRSFALVLPSTNVLERARILHAEQQWSFWDAMIVAACLEAGVTRLYSEDQPGHAPPKGLEVVNPFA